VIVGEYLFVKTISLIEQLKEPCQNGISDRATGGMVDPEHVLMLLERVQVQSTLYGFDYTA